MKNETALTTTARFNAIMTLVDAWAEDNAGWDCREDAVYEVEHTLADSDCVDWTDAEHAENAIAAWLMAE